MYVCFAEPKHQFGNWFNSLAAYVTGGKYCHVAIVFELYTINGTYVCKEASVVKTGHTEQDIVKLQEVEDFTDWTCFRLHLDKETERRAYNHVMVEWQGKPYDKVGSILDATLCCWLPRGYRSLTRQSESDKKTYCSRLAMKILQMCEQFPGHNPEKVTPNEIYRLIKDENKIINGKWEDVSDSVNTLISQEQGERTYYAESNTGVLFF